MIDERRHLMIDFLEVTPAIVAECIQTSINTLRHVRFAGDATDWVLLKWRGDKPAELWNEFPVYTTQEMIDILEDDLNSVIDRT